MSNSICMRFRHPHPLSRKAGFALAAKLPSKQTLTALAAVTFVGGVMLSSCLPEPALPGTYTGNTIPPLTFTQN